MASEAPRAALIEIVEPDPEDCPSINLPPEGNVKLRNYRLLTENLRAYTPTGDVHTSPSKGKLVAKYDSFASISPPRARILELVGEGDEGRDALHAIVRPAPRRLQRPLDDDARRFLQRALHSPSPYVSPAASPEPRDRTPESSSPEPSPPDSPVPTKERRPLAKRSLSLADELREAEDESYSGESRESFPEFDPGREEEADERERMGRLALAVAVEEEEAAAGGLAVCARRLDALLAESRALHDELAAIQQDLQTQCVRACRCTAAARALRSESLAVRYLDDVVALLRGDVAAAERARAWPFALGRRQPGRNYVV